MRIVATWIVTQCQQIFPALYTKEQKAGIVLIADYGWRMHASIYDENDENKLYTKVFQSNAWGMSTAAIENCRSSDANLCWQKFANVIFDELREIQYYNTAKNELMEKIYEYNTTNCKIIR